MKRIILCIAVVLSAMLAQAKEQTIVVKKDPLSSKGNTEVKIEQGNESDTNTAGQSPCVHMNMFANI